MKIHHVLTPRGERRPLTLAIGFFDGVHLGHRAILDQLQVLRRIDTALAVLTFVNHPSEYLRPNEIPPLLTVVEERVNLLAACGLDELYLLPFDAHVAEISARTFLATYLLEQLRVQALIVGEGFRFGHDREGDVALACEQLTPHGIIVQAAPQVQFVGERVSSTRIREALARAEMPDVDAMLGASYSISGTVMLGAGRGHDLGFPTANLRVDPRKALPCDGVYTVVARSDGRDYPGLLSLGTNPTFGQTGRSLEVWIKGFTRSIYGEQLRIEQLRFLREQQRFADVSELVVQMQLDAEALV